MFSCFLNRSRRASVTALSGTAVTSFLISGDPWPAAGSGGGDADDDG